MNVHEGCMDEKEQQLIFLVESCQSAVYKTCFFYLNDHALAEDAMQETFLKAYRAMASFRGECSEKTWLIHIAFNTCRDMQRSAWFRHMDRRITPEDLPLCAAMPHDENDPDMMCHIMQLPPKMKEVIMLYYWQEMTVTDIAKALGITHSTVSNRLKRARDKIRIMLERREPDGR